MEQILKRRLEVSWLVLCASCYGIATYTHIKSLVYEIEQGGVDLGASPEKML